MLKINRINKQYNKKNISPSWQKLNVFSKKEASTKMQVLKDITLNCEKGQVLGLIGPNGAGKTTLLKIISSLIAPDSGDISFESRAVLKKGETGKRNIGFLSADAGLYDRLTAKENIEYFAKLQGLNQRETKVNCDNVLSLLGIEKYKHKLVSTLSTGMKQKVAIARAIIHNPDIIILDEPTTGLDIMATESLLTIIKKQKALKKTIIFSTHHLDEIAAVADNIAVMNKGRLCFDGSIERFKATYETTELRDAFMASLLACEQHSDVSMLSPKTINMKES